MIRHLSFLKLLLVTLLTGCAYSLQPFSLRTEVRLQLQAARFEGYAIRVTATEPPSDYPFTPDGRVTFTVPPFRRGCTKYLFGVIKIADATPANTGIVELCRRQRVVHNLSLSQIAKLPEDAGGYRIVKVKD